LEPKAKWRAAVFGSSRVFVFSRDFSLLLDLMPDTPEPSPNAPESKQTGRKVATGARVRGTGKAGRKTRKIARFRLILSPIGSKVWRRNDE
jgi:hypothetical protein